MELCSKTKVLPFYCCSCGETFSKLTVRRKLICVNLSVNKLVGTSCVFSDQPTKGLKKQPSYFCLSLYFLKFEILWNASTNFPAIWPQERNFWKWKSNSRTAIFVGCFIWIKFASFCLCIFFSKLNPRYMILVDVDVI